MSIVKNVAMFILIFVTNMTLMGEQSGAIAALFDFYLSVTAYSTLT